jgi:hypothetical protein
LELLGSIRDGPSGLARVLRAAPQLESVNAPGMKGDFLFAASLPEVFTEGLVHPRLRSIDVWTLDEWKNIRADGVARLRRLCFPRLRRLTIGGRSPDVYQELKSVAHRCGPHSYCCF